MRKEELPTLIGLVLVGFFILFILALSVGDLSLTGYVSLGENCTTDSDCDDGLSCNEYFVCDTICTENWICSDWSECSNETQTRTCTDENGCGTEEDKLDETQICAEDICTENWICSDWSECSNETQTRTCTDSNNCGAEEDGFIIGEFQICTGEICGDGIIQNPNDNGINETCDDGTDNGQVCSPIYEDSCNYCSSECQVLTIQGANCGDEICDSEEDCDDCPADCSCNSGYTCESGSCEVEDEEETTEEEQEITQTESTTQTVEQIIAEMESSQTTSNEEETSEEKESSESLGEITGGTIGGELNDSECVGCSFNEKCYKFDKRKNDSYCTEGGWSVQKEINAICVEDFECLSNSCEEEKCGDYNWLRKFFDWVKNIFIKEIELNETQIIVSEEIIELKS